MIVQRFSLASDLLTGPINLLLPVVSGISYEAIRFTGKYKHSRLVQILSWPGLMLQRITTREPSDDQIEVAIAAMKKVI